MQKLFEKNIKFLYNNLPHYYNVIANLKQRNYYIKNDNIYSLHTNEPLYPNDIYSDSKIFAFNPIHNKNFEQKFAFVSPSFWDEREFPNTSIAINRLIKKAKELPSYKNDSFFFDKDFLPTTAIFGLLGGLHLQYLVENYEFQSLFVYEPNPEFFALSLYFVDYEFIYEKLKNRFFLWVNGKVDYFAIEKFYYERIVTSSFLNLFLTTYNHPLIEDAKEKFEQVRVSKFRGWGTFEDEIKGIKNHLKNINRFKIIKDPINLNVPVCVVANGKSLERNLEFIKKNIDSMIIISVGTAIKPLLKANITPDIHVEQERIDKLVDILKEVLPNLNALFIGSSVVNPKIFDMAKNKLMFVREGFTLEENLSIFGSSPIVGNAGFAIATLLSGEIYLCGMDLGFRLGAKKHAKDSFYDSTEDTASHGIKVKGNFSDDIYSDSLLLSSKLKIEQLIKALNLKVYNLSDGAYIEGSIPLKDKTLKKIEKKELIQKIKNSSFNANFTFEKPNLKRTLKKINKTLKLKITSYKELTGIIDFLEDVIKQKEFRIIKGSVFHTLFYLYVIAHKIDIKEFDKLSELFKGDEFKLEI